MRRSCFLGPVLLALLAAAACGEDGEDDGFDALISLVPGDAVDFYYVDVVAVEEDGDLETVIDNLLDSNEAALDEFEVDMEDVVSSGQFTLEDGTFALAIEAPDLDAEEFAERLEDDFAAEDDEEEGVTVWTLGDSDQVVLFLPGGRYVFRLTTDNYEEVIEAANGDGNTFVDEGEVAELVVDLDENPFVYIDVECDDIEGCLSFGESAAIAGGGDLESTLVVLFEDEDAAEDAEGDLEESETLDFILGPARNIETALEGESVVITYDVEAADGSY